MKPHPKVTRIRLLTATILLAASFATGAICDPESIDTCVDLDLPAPGPLVITDRTFSSVSFQYRAMPDWTSHQIQRSSLAIGPWSNIKSYTATSGLRNYTDGSRLADMPYCYRIRATNTHGTGYSSQGGCAMTTPASGTVNPDVTRLQLKVKVANVANAGTTDPIDVLLNRYALPGNNRTGLNYAARLPVVGSTTWVDDFAKNKEFTYDLDITNIKKLRDISEIRLEVHNKFGEWGASLDGVCIESFDLLVNGGLAYRRTFGTTGTTCRWLDDWQNNGTGIFPHFSVTREQLRAAPSFANFVNPPRAIVIGPDGTPSYTMPRAELESRVEGIIGNIIWGRGEIKRFPANIDYTVTVEWAHSSASGSSFLAAPVARRMSVSVDLMGHAIPELARRPPASTFPWPSTSTSTLRSTTSIRLDLEMMIAGVSATADLPWWLDWGGHEADIEAGIAAGFKPITKFFPAMTDAEAQRGWLHGADAGRGVPCGGPGGRVTPPFVPVIAEPCLWHRRQELCKHQPRR